MSGDALPRVVLDSNVIYSRVLHELFGRLATQALRFEVLWSDELLNEAHRVIRDEKPVSDAIAVQWVGFIRTNFPGGQIDISDIDPAINLAALTSDPDDHHVCALALAGNADLLLTFDQGFRRRAFAVHQVTVRHPDVFLAKDVDAEPGLYGKVIRSQAAAWGGGRSVEDLLGAYERARVPNFAHKARSLL